MRRPVLIWKTTLVLILAGCAASLFATNDFSQEENLATEPILGIEKISTARTAFFEISAEAPERATAAAKIAQEIEDYFIKKPSLWKKHIPALGMRVRVEILRQAGVFRLAWNDDGNVSLLLSKHFSEDENDLKIRCCFAEALLAQMFSKEKNANATAIPAWLVCAVAQESRLGSFPGRNILLQKKSTFAPAVSALELISADAEKFENDAIFQLNALWFLRAIETPEPFFKKQTPNEKKIAQAFPRFFKKRPLTAETIELFWTTRFKKTIAAAPAGINLPDESRRTFDDALLFLVEKDGNETRLLAGDLIACRLQQEIRDAVSARFASLAEHFKKLNPVWHNAFTEYGLFLEMFSNPDVSAETLSAQWNKALLARSEAIALQSEIKTLLDTADGQNTPSVSTQENAQK